MATYLDCASTTPIDPRVRDEVVRLFGADFGNAGSRTHDHGARSRQVVEHARDQIAAVLSAGRGDVLFTSGATESNNLAILGLAEHGRRTGRLHLVSTLIEHHAVLEPLQALEKQGFQLKLIAPRADGRVDAQQVRDAVRDDTLLVSVMHANNETGVIQPIGEIASLLLDHPAYFHVDAAQSFGREIRSLENERIDLISMSSHKIHGPTGVGALLTRRRGRERPPLTPLLHGGGQERGLRPGTLAAPLIAGFGLAAELAVREAEERAQVCKRFRERLLKALAPLRPVHNGDSAHALPHIVNLSFPGIDSEEAIEALRPIVSISNGSACTSASTSCSHVLSAMGLPAGVSAGATRWSWSHLTEEPDWARVVSILSDLGK